MIGRLGDEGVKSYVSSEWAREERIFDQLYEPYSTKVAKEASLSQRDAQQLQDASLTYGEVLFGPFAHILEKIRTEYGGLRGKRIKHQEEDESKHDEEGEKGEEDEDEEEDEEEEDDKDVLRKLTGGRRPLKFVDIGSGTGKAVYIAAMTQPLLTHAIGIEILPSLSSLATDVQRRWEETWKDVFYHEKLEEDGILGTINNFISSLSGGSSDGNLSSSSSQQPKRQEGDVEIQFLHGDAIMMGEEWWLDAHIVFMNSTCFSVSLFRQFAVLCEGLEAGSFVITTTRVLPSDKFELLEQTSMLESWGTSTVYIQRRKKE